MSPLEVKRAPPEAAQLTDRRAVRLSVFLIEQTAFSPSNPLARVPPVASLLAASGDRLSAAPLLGLA